MGFINIKVTEETIPERAEKGDPFMGNRRETIRSADAVYMAQSAWSYL